VLQLDKLADDVALHVRDHALRHTEAICADVDGGRFAAARRAWKALGADIARSRCHLAGPTWNALHHLVDPARRARARLPRLPRP